jgi:nitrate reductase delta subunit
MEEIGTTLKWMSWLLQYPDNRFLKQLPALEAALAHWPPSRLQGRLKNVLTQLQSQSLLGIQESYTAAFDLDPSTTLNMTYHPWGDSEKRAAALTRLQQLYMDAGYEIDTGELPDYLPLMLEFMAICPESRVHDTLRQCLAALPALAERLDATVPLYAELLKLIAGIAENRPLESPPPAAGDDTLPRRNRIRPKP